MQLSRRSLLKATAVSGAAITLSGGLSATASPSKAAAAPVNNFANDTGDWLVGLGLADITGAPAGQGMMGFAQEDQIAHGIRQRYLARAVIFVDKKTNAPLVHVTVDTCAFFANEMDELLSRLQKTYSGRYNEKNVIVTATHNHNSCGGTSRDLAYVLATKGHQENSFRCEVDGVLEAIARAHNNIAPAQLYLGRSELYNASKNRSVSAFNLNPEHDKREMPGAIDPRVWVLRIKRGTKDVGVMTWFATHGTSLTDNNTLLSPDNKGLAAYIWEHDEMGVDYMTTKDPFVAAFIQTNSGDMTPNLWLRKLHPSGPTSDNVLNNAIIAKRQYDACHKAWANAVPLRGSGIATSHRYVDFAHEVVPGKYTVDGKQWRTVPTVMGASGAASSEEDNYESVVYPYIREGNKGPFTKFWDWDRKNQLLDADWDYQSPKLNFLPLGYLPVKGWNPQELPLTIFRLGELVFVCGALEFTIVSGLRCRRLVSKRLGVPMENVIFQGYTNSYCQYCVTPEEYMAMQYEAGETQFGRETLGAHLKHYDAMCDELLGRGKPYKSTTNRAYKANMWIPSWLPAVPADTLPKGKKYGDVLLPPPATVKRGAKLDVDFQATHLNNKLYRGSTYHEVQKLVGGKWVRIADDFHYDTILDWRRPDGSKTESITRVTWNIPKNQPTGTYRIVLRGDAKSKSSKLTHWQGKTNSFKVV